MQPEPHDIPRMAPLKCFAEIEGPAWFAGSGERRIVHITGWHDSSTVDAIVRGTRINWALDGRVKVTVVMDDGRRIVSRWPEPLVAQPCDGCLFDLRGGRADRQPECELSHDASTGPCSSALFPLRREILGLPPIR